LKAVSARRVARGVLALAAVLWLGGVQAASAPYEAQYSFERYGLVGGRAVQSLSYPRPGQYRMAVDVQPTGVVTLFTRERITEVSTGAVGREGALQPERYEHRRSGGRDRYRDFRFDRAAGVLRDATGGIPDRPLPPGLQDDLTVTEALRAALRRGAPATLEVPVLYAGKGRIQRYRYVVGARAAVETPAGHFETVRVTRTDDRGRYRVELWCAPGLDYLPVRLDRYRKEEFEARMLLMRHGAPTLAPEPAAAAPG
jgi:hypothetical protein